MGKKEVQDKVDTKATPAAPAEAAPANTSTALVRLQQAGLTVPAVQDLDKLTVIAQDKLGALAALLNDGEISDATKTKITDLLAQANPVKPGMEEVNTKWSVARINMVQPTTNDPKKPESAKPGDLFTTAGALLERPFGLIPIWFNQENIMFEEGSKAPACYSPDAKLGSPYGICTQCPNLPFGQQNGGRGDQKKTDCNNQIVVACLAQDLSQVYILTFAKTSRSAGSALLALAKAHPFPWKQSYLLSTEKKAGEKGVYHVYKIEPTGKDNPPEVQKLAKALNELYGANRKLFLAEWYLKAASAGSQAAQNEAQFSGDVIEGGLAEGGVEDFAPVQTGSVKSGAKPL